MITHSKNKVVFIHRGGPTMASYRYRCEIPARELNKLGYEASINQGVGEIVIFSKPVEDDVRLARECKDAGAKIIFDICDPHFHLRHYQDMFDIADGYVFPSFGMDVTIAPAAHRYIIPDPYEMPEMRPHANDDSVLWFGHEVNLPDVEPYQKLCTFGS